MRKTLLHSTTPTPKLLGRATLALLALTLGHAHAASLGGTVTNEIGEPLAKVPVCLQTPASGPGCAKVRSTDRQGNYQFNGLKAGMDYRVAIFQDDSAAGRKFERYRTYVWEPLYQEANLARKNESRTMSNFSGKFNFSNFQRGLTLTAADFPELASLDLVTDYVFIKIYLPSDDPAIAPETIYLGRVASQDSLQVAASLPLSTTLIAYQIYSATLTIDGSILLADI
jgi:hypothetical protein